MRESMISPCFLIIIRRTNRECHPIGHLQYGTLCGQRSLSQSWEDIDMAVHGQREKQRDLITLLCIHFPSMRSHHSSVHLLPLDESSFLWEPLVKDSGFMVWEYNDHTSLICVGWDRSCEPRESLLTIRLSLRLHFFLISHLLLSFYSCQLSSDHSSGLLRGTLR